MNPGPPIQFRFAPARRWLPIIGTVVWLVTISGFVVVYDAAGRLGFDGGITAERGHAGDNGGTDANEAILKGEKPRPRAASPRASEHALAPQ